MKTIADINIQGKKIIVREDFNVPMDEQGNITHDQRLLAALPTIKILLEKGAAVILLSHLGRPTEGVFEEKWSLKPVADYLSKALNQTVRLEKDYLEGNTLDIHPGEVVLCENVRLNPGEKKNDAVLAQKMAQLGDYFVMDAFATSHRAEASTCGIAAYLPSVAGPLLVRELEALERVMKHPKTPVTAIVGGAKVSDKLVLLRHLVTKVNTLIVGGGIANTFLAACGKPVGESLYESALLDEARAIMQLAEANGCLFPLPEDVVVAETLAENATTTIKESNQVASHDKIFDIGPKTITHLAKIIQSSGTILWNGPMGVFEFMPFSEGTRAMAKAIAQSNAFSVAGGGDTLSAVECFGVTDKISYLSTGGGAFLEYIEGKTLPAIAALEASH